MMSPTNVEPDLQVVTIMIRLIGIGSVELFGNGSSFHITTVNIKEVSVTIANLCFTFKSVAIK